LRPRSGTARSGRSVGGGAIKIVISGHQRVHSITVNPDVSDTSYAEWVNGRFAMLGFTAVLLIEALSRDTFLHWAGLVP
jgi:hypothetical protein